MLASSERYPCLLMQQTHFDDKFNRCWWIYNLHLNVHVAWPPIPETALSLVSRHITLWKFHRTKQPNAFI